jgi:prepilin-type processing-associated H-X9-DG protein
MIAGLFDMAVPAPRAFAWRMKLCPVLEGVSAVEAPGRVNYKSACLLYAFLHMGQMNQYLFDGHVQLRRQFLNGVCPGG